MPIWSILGGKGDFSASFIILIVVFSTQLHSRGLLMSKKKNVEWAIYGPGSMRTPPLNF